MTLHEKWFVVAIVLATIIGGCLGINEACREEWVPVTVLSVNPRVSDGWHDKFEHTTVLTEDGRAYRLSGLSWGEAGTKVTVNLNASYSWDN